MSASILTPQEKAKETKKNNEFIRQIDLIAAELGEAIGFHFNTGSQSVDEAFSRLHRFVQHTHMMSPRTRWKTQPQTQTKQPRSDQQCLKEMREANRILKEISSKLKEKFE